MRKIIYILLIGSAVGMNAQTGSNPTPTEFGIELFPKTPEASAMSKFVDIPAGSYTGVADFSIPLYTIEFDGEKIPIELRYTTTGIKVGQIATNVGLGWVMNTGPSLSQQVIGGQDRAFPRPSIPSSYEISYDGTENPSYLLALKYTGKRKGNTVYPYDAKPDIFNYRLLNNSGKYIIDASGTFGIPMPYNQIKIRPSTYYLNPNVLPEMDITDEKGFHYNFKEDQLKIKSHNTCYDENLETLINHYNPNFKLYTVKSPKNQTISYIYNKSKQAEYLTSIVYQKRLRLLPGMYETAMPQESLPLCTNYTNSNENELTEIQFKGGRVLFTYNSDPRLDIPGGVYITQVVVKNDNDEIIKNYTLNYDYFQSPNDYNPILATGLLGSHREPIMKRLKLINVTDNLTNGVYELEYYENYNGKTMPHRLSNDQDFWGVYNGKENGYKSTPHTKFGRQSDNFMQIVDYQYSGANKQPDINYGKLGNLRKIIYPTRGYTQIDYEADDFIKLYNVPYVYDYAKVNDTVNYVDDSNPNNFVQFTIPNDYYHKAYNKTLKFYGNEGSGGTTQNQHCKWKLSKEINGVFVPHKEAWSQGIHDRDNIDLPGTYRLSIKQNTDLGATGCNATYTWIDETLINDSDIRQAGTIRVKKIESVDNNNGSIIREYTYKEPTVNNVLPYTQTSGKNLGNERFISISTKEFPFGRFGNYAIENLLINNPAWQTSTVNGKPVGYDYVQEYYTDSKNPANSYRKEYKFKNDFDDIYMQYEPFDPINYTWPINGLDRGMLLEEKLFDSTNNLVKETINDYTYDPYFNSKSGSYQFSQPGVEWLGEGLEIIPIRHGVLNSNNQSITSYQFKYYTFPMINHWITNTLTTVRDYTDAVNYIETKSHSKYSVPEYKHTYPIETSREGSGGDVLKATYKYPQDVTAGDVGAEQFSVMEILKNKNQLAGPLISKTFNNSVVTSEKRTLVEEFHPGSQSMILPKYIYLKKGANATSTDRKITYDSYDNQGNLTQYTLESSIPVSIIWGYNQTVPIAKLEGVEYENIKNNSLVIAIVNASNEDNMRPQGMTPEQTEQALIDALDNLRQNSDFLNYPMTTYSYDPLIGVKSVTPPSGLREIYVYDTSSRLIEVKRMEKDTSGNFFYRTLSENEYHYKP